VTSPFGRLRLVTEPAAGRGAVGRSLPALTGALRGRGLEFEVVEVAGWEQAAAAARAALDDGLRFVVAAGDDGTVHGVVNGLAANGARVAADVVPRVAADVVLGVAQAGAGCDFARTFGLDRPPEVVARQLDGDATMAIDLGVIRYRDDDGRPASRLFANVAEAGFGAEALRLAGHLPRALGRVRDLLAAYAAIRCLDRQETEVVVAHARPRLPVVELVVANGQFFRDGMKVAPRALPDDGRFNVQVFSGARSQVFTMTPQIFRGEHLPHPQIVEYQTPSVRFAPPRPLAVTADGQLLGRTPAEFTIAARALRLKI
jgi:diacylglycerol kinase family enzyme